jgi:hypothetical protein
MQELDIELDGATKPVFIRHWMFGVGRSAFSSSSLGNEIECALRRITMSGSGPNGKKQCLE